MQAVLPKLGSLNGGLLQLVLNTEVLTTLLVLWLNSGNVADHIGNLPFVSYFFICLFLSVVPNHMLNYTW